MKKSKLFLDKEAFIYNLQSDIVSKAQNFEGKKKFICQKWSKPHSINQGDAAVSRNKDEPNLIGAGMYRYVEDADFFEKASVNVSSAKAELSEGLAKTLGKERQGFRVCGISLIFHPKSPMIPSAHLNFRRFELEDGDSWYGGGIDISPYYPFEEDFVVFHAGMAKACNAVSPSCYREYKQNCDDYFYLKHRKEMRGIGGVFYDYKDGDEQRYFHLAKALAKNFQECYFSIAEKRKTEIYRKEHRDFQMIRRGRYIEFNLLYDKGTQFGLRSGGNVEAIFMSMPLLASFPHAYTPKPGTFAEKMTEYYQPRDWLNFKMEKAS